MALQRPKPLKASLMTSTPVGDSRLTHLLCDCVKGVTIVAYHVLGPLSLPRILESNFGFT